MVAFAEGHVALRRRGTRRMILQLHVRAKLRAVDEVGRSAVVGADLRVRPRRLQVAHCQGRTRGCAPTARLRSRLTRWGGGRNFLRTERIGTGNLRSLLAWQNPQEIWPSLQTSSSILMFESLV